MEFEPLLYHKTFLRIHDTSDCCLKDISISYTFGFSTALSFREYAF